VILRSDPSHRHTCKPIPYSIFDAAHRPINPEEPKLPLPTAALATTKEVKVATKLEVSPPPMVSKEATKRPQGRPRKHPLPSLGKVQEEVPQEAQNRQPLKRYLKRGRSLGKSKSLHEWDAEVYKTRELEAKSRFEEIAHALNNA
jgi:hypothetical protein